MSDSASHVSMLDLPFVIDINAIGPNVTTYRYLIIKLFFIKLLKH